MANCSGPCLEHCYSNNSMLYLIVAIFIGLISGVLLSKLYINQPIKNTTPK